MRAIATSPAVSRWPSARRWRHRGRTRSGAGAAEADGGGGDASDTAVERRLPCDGEVSGRHRQVAAEVCPGLVGGDGANVLRLRGGEAQGEEGESDGEREQQRHTQRLAWSASNLGEGKHGDAAAPANGETLAQPQ